MHSNESTNEYTHTLFTYARVRGYTSSTNSGLFQRYVRLPEDIELWSLSAPQCYSLQDAHSNIETDAVKVAHRATAKEEGPPAGTNNARDTTNDH